MNRKIVSSPREASAESKKLEKELYVTLKTTGWASWRIQQFLNVFPVNRWSERILLLAFTILGRRKNTDRDSIVLSLYQQLPKPSDDVTLAAIKAISWGKVIDLIKLGGTHSAKILQEARKRALESDLNKLDQLILNH